MACSELSPCGGFLTEDIVFREHAIRAEMHLRRYTCMNGHSHYHGTLAEGQVTPHNLNVRPGGDPRGKLRTEGRKRVADDLV